MAITGEDSLENAMGQTELGVRSDYRVVGMQTTNS